MHTVITIVHILDAFVLILIVLLQQGKGAGMGLAFGGGSQTVFGASGAGNFLTKLTAWAAVVFMVTSLSLAYLSGKAGTSIMQGIKPPPAAAAPATKGAVTAPTQAATGATQAKSPAPATTGK